MMKSNITDQRTFAACGYVQIVRQPRTSEDAQRWCTNIFYVKSMWCLTKHGYLDNVWVVRNQFFTACVFFSHTSLNHGAVQPDAPFVVKWVTPLIMFNYAACIQRISGPKCVTSHISALHLSLAHYWFKNTLMRDVMHLRCYTSHHVYPFCCLLTAHHQWSKWMTWDRHGARACRSTDRPQFPRRSEKPPIWSTCSWRGSKGTAFERQLKGTLASCVQSAQLWTIKGYSFERQLKYTHTATD